MTMATNDIKKQKYEFAISRIITNINDEDNDLLHDSCREIDIYSEPDLRHMKNVIEDLKETAKNLNYKSHGCLGLAANQLGYNVRIFVIRTKSGKYKPYVNPVILNGTKLESSMEGCLSVPNKKYYKKRNKEISVKSSITYQEFLRGDESKAFQHELDHLNGKLISDE